MKLSIKWITFDLKAPPKKVQKFEFWIFSILNSCHNSNLKWQVARHHIYKAISVFFKKLDMKIGNVHFSWMASVSWYKLPDSRTKTFEAFVTDLSKVFDSLPSNFLKAAFHKFYLVYSWILRLIYHRKLNSYSRIRKYSKNHLNPFLPSVVFHIETSYLIWLLSVGFRMKNNTGEKWFN